MKDILSFKLTNVLPESVVNAFADYWSDDDNIRKENLGEFIQRIAEYTIRTHQADPVGGNIERFAEEIRKQDPFAV